MAGQFEIFGENAHYRFRLTGQDNEVLAVSGVFGTKAKAAQAIMAVRESAAAAHIVDHSAVETGARPHRRAPRQHRTAEPAAA